MVINAYEIEFGGKLGCNNVCGASVFALIRNVFDLPPAVSIITHGVGHEC